MVFTEIGALDLWKLKIGKNSLGLVSETWLLAAVLRDTGAPGWLAT